MGRKMPVDGVALGQLRAHVARSSGAAAAAWLDDLPARIAAVEAAHGIVLDPPFAARSYNYVAPVRGSPLAAKLYAPGEPEALSEVRALVAFDGAGAVRVRSHDEARAMFLMDRVRPGGSADGLPDAQSTAIAADLLARLHRAPPPAGAIRLEDWFAALWASPRWPAEAARARALFDSAPPPVLLHGDLHHYNVLQGTGPSGEAVWTSIDPKGLVGDPAFDVAMWLCNEIDGPDPIATIRARAERFARALGCDRGRIYGWAAAQSVLSACWAEEGGVDPGPDLAHVARIRAAAEAG